MKINALQISNIFSFEDREIDKTDIIDFESGLNILIGPNGSGKSNLVEIINQLFKRILIIPFSYSEGQGESARHKIKSGFGGSLREQSDIISTLRKNNNSHSDKMQINITLKLSDDDFENIIFLKNNIKDIRILSELYCDRFYFSDFQTDFDVLGCPKVVTIRLEKENGNTFNTHYDGNFLSKVVVIYIKYFYLLQYLVYLGNTFHNKNWKDLRNTFALIGSNRDYHDINFKYRASEKPKDVETNSFLSILKEGTKNPIDKDQGKFEPPIFPYVKNKLFSYYHQLKILEENSENQESLGSAKKLLDDYSTYKSIKNEIKNVLRYDLKYRMNFTGYEMIFQDQFEKELDINDLSSGEKGILHFIFSLYGLELNDGLIVIDEPELHIHPKIQKKYLDILQRIIENNSLQIIVITHSSHFIDLSSIGHTMRLYKDSNFTQWVRPKIDMNNNLIQFIDYTNSSKIFFTNRVLLVEGQDDEIFFNFFIEKFLYNRTSGQDDDFEIISIDSKESFDRWKLFLNDYKIECHFIGDLDNILYRKEFEHVVKPLKEEFIRKPEISKMIQEDEKFEGNKTYNKYFLDFLKTEKITDWERIKKIITQLYTEGMYFLQEGDLEFYLGLTKRKRRNTQQIINFCKENLQHNLSNVNIDAQKKTELIGILSHIF